MSLPTGYWSSHRRSSRAASVSTRFSHHDNHSASPGPADDSSSNVTPAGELPNNTPLRSNHDPIPIYGSVSMSHREPTRSFFHSSYRSNPAPIDSGQTARNVREDTADLASYALTENASLRSLSPTPSRRPSSAAQPHIDSYFAQESNAPTNDHDTLLNTRGDRPGVIHEVSEPVSPAMGPASHSSGSALTDLLRRSPPSKLRSIGMQNESGHIFAKGVLDRHMSDLEEAVVDMDQNDAEDTEVETSNSHVKLSPPSPILSSAVGEETPLIAKPHEHEHHPDYIHGESDLEGQKKKRSPTHLTLLKSAAKPFRMCQHLLHTISNPKSWNRKTIWERGVVEPVGYLPSVLLGTLLNILDALSYGMILFPLGMRVFDSLGPVGISLFYVSCIISQLTYSLGGSIFKGGIGSEMIEVVPFFHKMATVIVAEIGDDPSGKNDAAIIATTITCYALSSIITGTVFGLMGFFNFGYIVGFIPRHILIGCIGGVGVFLILTGVEVTARLPGNLDINLATLQQLFQQDTIILWTLPLFLAIVLYKSQHLVNSRYYLPSFILMIPLIFYFFVFSINDLSDAFYSTGPKSLRQMGWLFDAPESNESWYHFYTLYNFKVVDWSAVARAVPAMFALTFFGVLHVPINVPALAFQTGEDHMNLDKELIAHGISNFLSGAFGSIQNYLVYTNSLVFIRAGGDSRVAGVMLAGATFIVMIYSTLLVPIIPVMMVGVLIYVLGFELTSEALVDTFSKLDWLEYGTVIAIVLVMGFYDFVTGIFVGIGLAFVSFVVQTSRIPAVRASYSGEIAGSTVRRNPVQKGYLRQVGKQIHVTKLAGYLFFGTIVSVEDRIRTLVENSEENHIRYLIFDLYHVTGIDYSAAEAFKRINRIFTKLGVTIVMSGVDANGPIGIGLRNAGIEEDGNNIQLLEDLNSALESCENELLKAFYSRNESRLSRNAATLNLDVPQRAQERPERSYSIDVQFSSPRQYQLHEAAKQTLKEHDSTTPKWGNFKEPLKLILQTFSGLTSENEDFWFRALPYFVRREFSAGSILYHCGQVANGFYLLDSGILRAEYDLPQGKYYESIVAGTTCGELPFFSETDRTATVQAERDCVVWVMEKENWEKLQRKDGDVAKELLRIGLKLTSERMSSITSYVLTTAG